MSSGSASYFDLMWSELVRLVEEGHLIGEFKGFGSWGTRFELKNGSVWLQNEHTHRQPSGGRAFARVYEVHRGYFLLYVEGLEMPISVKRP